ncbi:hypothetical protein EST38_g10520 [Candolleomyces aberdarensis]|uniref:Uncharacterized protein n=1 Tax=Candolleomyces aberdarensis TaxID=2316362 RepID=A0A4Q2D770_9AGAR|nr:hypothetical protein EST38_g10520 [Candolleomyces aberdarensis]
MSVQPSQNSEAYTSKTRNAQQANTGETSKVEAPQGNYETRKADQANTGYPTRAQGQLGNSGSPANNVTNSYIVEESGEAPYFVNPPAPTGRNVPTVEEAKNAVNILLTFSDDLQEPIITSERRQVLEKVKRALSQHERGAYC